MYHHLKTDIRLDSSIDEQSRLALSMCFNILFNSEKFDQNNFELCRANLEAKKFQSAYMY